MPTIRGGGSSGAGSISLNVCGCYSEEGMKVHFNELLKEMVEHDEITGYIILEDICLEGRGMSIFSDHDDSDNEEDEE